MVVKMCSLQVGKECDALLKLLNACLEEMSKFDSECSSFESWLTAAEDKLKLSQGRISKPETLEQREAAHKVCLAIHYDTRCYSNVH